MATWILLGAMLPVALADEAYVPTPEDIQNDKVWHYMLWTWIAIMLAMLVYRWTITLTKHVRRIANLSNGSSTDDKQRYFTIPDENYAWAKRWLILAPFWKKRHNREYKLSAAVNVCTLPSRLQSLFLGGYLLMNIVFVTYKIDWDNTTNFLEQAVKRFGILSTMNMIPLFLLAGRNNPLIFLLGVSFDTYNLIHRWIGRIAVLEGLAHTLFWMFGKVHEKGSWDPVWASFSHSMIWSGTIGMVAFLFLFLHSPGLIRHAFYETFLHAHIIIAAVSCAGLWIHLQGMSFLYMLQGAMVLWILERAVRFVTILRHNVGSGGTKAEVEALPGDCVRVTLRIAKPWKFRPGQHLYMYMPSVGLWTSHPFSIAWSEEESSYSDEKGLPVSRSDTILGNRKATMSCIIRRRTGFTDRMWTRAESAPAGKFITTAFVEGPYGNQSFQSYGSVMLFAAGIGIAHQVPHIRDLVAGYANGTAATRKVTLVWIIQSPEHLEWIRPWMTQILGMEGRRDVLRILLFVTRPRSTKEIHSPSSSVQMFPGKPDVAALVDKEQERQVGAMAVSVCGTGSLADDCRNAVRERLEKTEIDFFEEAFSW